ncbi:MAG: formate/nitrite transporter family protein [Acidaminococcales bacterium]|jgi:formate/nitrite transporter|nr:formate/nitrite transporter family protein [Acidaminococcales bacterium]
MSLKNPEEAYLSAAAAGEKRAGQTALRTLALSFLGGAYIGMGGFFALRATGGLPAAVWGTFGNLLFGGLFPIGLMLIVLTGAELFTGNCLTLAGAFFRGKIKFGAVLKNWIFSWIGNFGGAAFFAWAMVYASGLIFETTAAGMPWAEKIVGIANAKTSLGFADAFLRGVLANWLVCLAVSLAGASDTLPGKVLGLWPPVTAFVVMGAEHSIANMFFVPLGIFAGGDPFYTASGGAPALAASWETFAVANLLPVTLGNIVGGAIFAAGFHHLLYQKAK